MISIDGEVMYLGTISLLMLQMDQWHSHSSECIIYLYIMYHVLLSTLVVQVAIPFGCHVQWLQFKSLLKQFDAGVLEI
jgi:hypothetical protein